jgi:hypothetical protein
MTCLWNSECLHRGCEGKNREGDKGRERSRCARCLFQEPRLSGGADRARGGTFVTVALRWTGADRLLQTGSRKVAPFTCRPRAPHRAQEAGRPARHPGTYEFFKKTFLYGGDYKEDGKQQPGSAEVVQSVANDKFAIGYSGLGYKTEGVRTIPLAAYHGRECYDTTLKRPILASTLLPDT